MIATWFVVFTFAIWGEAYSPPPDVITVGNAYSKNPLFESDCPQFYVGLKPNCRPAPECPPDFIGTPPHCRADPYLPPQTTPAPRCGPGLVGYPPDCHKPVIYEPGPCPTTSGWHGDKWPHCTYRYNFTIVPYKGCEHGLIGYPPNCYKPCPAHREFFFK